jgi:hypothetical protein
VWSRSVLAYLWFGLLAFLFFSPAPVSSGDSGGYRDSTHRSLEMLAASLRGHTGRPASIIVPFVLFGHDTSIEIAQSIILGLAFTFLILTVYAIPFLGVASRSVIAFLLATTVLSQQLVSWNVQILSESLSVSYCVLALGCSMRFLLTRRVFWLLLAGGATAFAVTAKPPLFAIFGPVLAALMVTVLWDRRRSASTEGHRLVTRPMVKAAGVALTVLAILALSAWYDVRLNDTRFALGVPAQEDSIMHLISTDNPISQVMRQSLETTTIPRCLPLGHPVPIQEAFVLEGQLAQMCPSLRAWSVHNYDRWYLQFIVGHPGATRRYLVDLLPFALGSHIQEPVVAVVLPPVSDAIWGTTITPNAQVVQTSPELLPTGFEDIVPVLVAAANAVMLWLLSSRRRRVSLGRHRLGILLLLVWVIDAALAVMTWQVLYLPTSSLELARLGLECNVLLRVALIVLACMGVESLWRRTGGRSARGQELRGQTTAGELA